MRRIRIDQVCVHFVGIPPPAAQSASRHLAAELGRALAQSEDSLTSSRERLDAGSVCIDRSFRPQTLARAIAARIARAVQDEEPL
jgi:hypothetical protein